MLELLELERIIAEEESYTLQFKVPKSLFPFYQDVFRSLGQAAATVSYKARLAEQLSAHKQADRERELRRTHDGIKAEMRELYKGKLAETRSHVEAMKALTRSYKPYDWLRNQLKKEIQAQWELRISKMTAEGKTSIQIADALGISPGAVRKIMSKSRTHLKSLTGVV